jgi:hypothetical protein
MLFKPENHTMVHIPRLSTSRGTNPTKGILHL